MYSPKIKRYQKKFDYTYAFGAYPVLDLLKYYPQNIYTVLFKKEGLKSDGVEEILKICQEKGINTEVNDRAIDKISVKENTYVVGVFKKYESKLEDSTNHLVLVNPSNMGNMGTVIRTMLGFGFRDLGIIKPSVDIFDPLVIRSTMGAIFNIHFEFFNNIEEYIKRFPKQNIYSFMLNGSKNIRDIKFEKPYTLIQGNESTGLEDKYLELGESIYIPHSKEIDSLNLSVATAIGLWEARRDEE
ncbi:MAG TPA: TrmH family RNA methyltransferase [Candidatus Dojkabacteria bacterium]|nr:TrmH family RNA methyltransferase [Candidatus Dojkabacteria bacterium]